MVNEASAGALHATATRAPACDVRAGRFDLEPIRALLKLDFRAPGDGRDPEAPGLEVLAELADVSGKTARRWWRDGAPAWACDPLAVAAGVMPWQVWPEWDLEPEPDDADDLTLEDDPPVDELDPIDAGQLAALRASWALLQAERVRAMSEAPSVPARRLDGCPIRAVS